MFYTDWQMDLLKRERLCEVEYKVMYSKKKELGYCKRNRRRDGYDIVLAQDAPSENVQKIVLMHELGHISLFHLEVDMRKEIKNVKNIFKSLNKPYEWISKFGGPVSFINICMDLEVNSKFLTLSNENTMKDSGFPIWSAESAKIDVEESFRDYYEPLIKNLDEDSEDFQDQPDLSFLQDLASTPSSFDFDDEDIKDQMNEESYKDGEDKESGNTKSVRTSSTGEIAKEEVDKDIEEDDTKQKRYAGSDYSSSRVSNTETINLTKDCNVSQEIKKFLDDIITNNRKPIKLLAKDYFSHYNRGTRKNDVGLLYPAQRKKVDLHPSRKVGILIDVSGSMEIEEVITAISSLKQTSLDKDSLVVLWDTDLVQEFNIDNIPEKLKSGGATEIGSGIEYLINKGMRDIVVYSDFQTHEDPLEKALLRVSKKRIGFYSIHIDDSQNREKGYELRADDEIFKKVNRKTLRIPRNLL